MWRPPKNQNILFGAVSDGRPIVVFDTETTGLKPFKGDVVIQFAGVLCHFEGDMLIEDESFQTYINPQCSLPPKITELTGITDETLVNAPTEAEAFPNIANFLMKGSYFAGQNLGFDIEFLTAMFDRQGYAFWEDRPILDTLEMARDLLELKEYNLSSLLAHFELDKDLSFHNAMEDVRACARLLRIFVAEYRANPMKVGMLRPTVFSANFWEGFKGQSRVYINTSLGKFFYEIRYKRFNESADSKSTCQDVDMFFVLEKAIERSNDEKAENALLKAKEQLQMYQM